MPDPIHRFSQRAVPGLRAEYCPLEMSFAAAIDDDVGRDIAQGRLRDLQSTKLLARATDDELVVLRAEKKALDALVEKYAADKRAANPFFQAGPR